MLAALNQTHALGILIAAAAFLVLWEQSKHKRSRPRRRLFRRGRARRLHFEERRDFTADERAEILRLDNGCCVYCRAEGYDVPVHYKSDCTSADGCDFCFEVDHVLAHSRGGRTALTNAVTSCRLHNRAKGARRVEDFMGPRRRHR